MGNVVDKVMFPLRVVRNTRISIKVIERFGIEYLFCRNEASDDVILYSHGNNETLDDIWELVISLSQRCHVSVLAYEYPDNASAERVNDTILNVQDYMCRVLGFLPGNTILMGRSIGTGPTLWLASYLHLELGIQFKGIVLVSPLSSVHHYLRIRFPCGVGYLLAWFIEERYDNMRAIERVGDTPVLLLHGEEDRVLDPMMSQVLYARYPGSADRCVLTLESHHTHNSIMSDMHILEAELLKFFMVMEDDCNNNNL